MTPEFARGLADRGYRGLLADDLVRMRIHRVTLEEIDALKALGFGGLGADELVKFPHPPGDAQLTFRECARSASPPSPTSNWCACASTA